MQYKNFDYASPNLSDDDTTLYETMQEGKTRLVIDETTIYEVDIECEMCKNRNGFLDRRK